MAVRVEGEVSQWPRCLWDEQLWSPVSGLAGVDTYFASLPPMISNVALPQLRGRTATAATAALVAVSRLDMLLEAMGPLERRSVQAVLFYQEALASSQISGVVSSAEKVAYARLVDQCDPVAEGVAAISLANSAAATINDIHHALFRRTRPHSAGRQRNHQVWCGSAGSTPRTAAYVPPHHERIDPAMDDLRIFVRDCAGQPLATAAAAYGQLSAIRPYMVGNGRAGRALMTNLFARWGITRHIPVPVAVGLAADPNGHVVALEAFRSGDPVAAISLIAEAIVTGAAALAETVAQLQGERLRMRDLVRSTGTKRADSIVWSLLTYLLGQPVITTGRAGRAVGSDRTTGHKYAGRLSDAGIIVPSRISNPVPVWQSDEVLRIWAGSSTEIVSEGSGVDEVA